MAWLVSRSTAVLGAMASDRLAYKERHLCLVEGVLMDG